MSDTFPKRAVVYPGCLLAMITNAISTSQCALSAVYDQWCENMYMYDGTDSTHAAIAFGGDSLVGTVFDKDSERSPFRRDEPYDLDLLFQGMPASHQPLAQQCLNGWCQEWKGKMVRLITAAFWDSGEYLAAAEPWEQVWKNGAWVLSIQFMEDQEAALAEWQNQHGLSPAGVILARSLFQRKMAQPHAIIELTPADMQLLLTPEEGVMADILRKFAGGPEALEASRQAFATIGISVPQEWEEE